MKIIRYAAALSVAFAAPLAAQELPQAPPKLIVAISVDQFSADLFAQFRQHFTRGLRRLSEGVVFPSGYQAHAATETCPGHSTILTGSRPARTGIIANNWFNQRVGRPDTNVYCAEDPRVPGSTSEKYTVSSYHLRVPSLGDHMKRADKRARVAVASGKDRAAIMMGGYAPDQRWWWSGKDFTSDPTGPQPARAGALVNASIADALSRARDPLTTTPLCEARSRPITVAGTDRKVGTGHFARAAGDSRAYRASPELDGATLALAASLQQEMQLGKGPATDLLIVGLSATDYVGHSYGTQGTEMCLQLLSLDRSLGDFFARLDAQGLDYLVVLTADHGGHDIPERHREHGIPEAARVDPALNASTMGKALGQRLGYSGPVLFGDGAFGDIYVDQALAPPQRQRVLQEAVSTYRSHPQVAEVFTAAQLRATPSPSGPPDKWSLIERARASYDPERSGDFVVLLKPRVTPIFDTSRGYVATHGSPWDYDRRVPILFWRSGMRPFEQPLAVETVDILPTLASLLEISIPADTIDGRCLDIVEGPDTSC
ncbi:MAG: alkaline phosphatase family protein [Pseudomonadota bacterium]|nr:alkaline phosphatase family protein [Pseudomonadota bacterium]